MLTLNLASTLGVLNKLPMLRPVQKLLAAMIFKAIKIWRQCKNRKRHGGQPNALAPEAMQFEFDRNVERIMALPANGPHCEYCEIQFVPVRESGSIFDGSGYFSVRRIDARGELVPDPFFSALHSSPVVRSRRSFSVNPFHRCRQQAEYLEALLGKLIRDGWDPINRPGAAGAVYFFRRRQATQHRGAVTKCIHRNSICPAKHLS